MLWVSILLGVVEGLTEFLPISSTGHLIVTSSLVGFHGKRADFDAIVPTCYYGLNKSIFCTALQQIM